MQTSLPDTPVLTAVITGGHPFDVPGFHRLFRSMESVDAYIQDLANFVDDWGAARRDYGALVFYNMHVAPPEEPWASALAELASGGQGIVVLHHALLAWPASPLWSDVCGIADRSFGYHPGQRVQVSVADAEHPITRGLTPWEMGDETYTMADCGSDSHVLLTVDHPLSMHTAAWTRTRGDQRVVCLQSGHDQEAWGNPSFRVILQRAILWAAGRL